MCSTQMLVEIYNSPLPQIPSTRDLHLEATIWHHIKTASIWQQIHFGKYSGDRNPTFLLDCKWSRFWMASELQKPNHLKSGQMAVILSKTIWNPDKNVWILNGWDYNCSHSKSQTIWKPEHLQSDLQKVRISDPYCTGKLQPWRSYLDCLNQGNHSRSCFQLKASNKLNGKQKTESYTFLFGDDLLDHIAFTQKKHH